MAAGRDPDVILIGAGIMSATLGFMLKELDPQLHISVYERLDTIAGESSDAWNNAGTGHSAFCELNYTPKREDGSVDIAKAVKIAAMFETSREFWSYLVQQRYIADPRSFITGIPHMSFVTGETDIAFLKQRFETMTAHHLFRGMRIGTDNNQLRDWMPLVMQGRNANEPVAATRMDAGTDVNFGALTRGLFRYLNTLPGFNTYLRHEVRDLEQEADGRWKIQFKDLDDKERSTARTGFVFIGVGGGALPLLERSGIPEAKGYGGFPVSGQWLVCNNETVIARHAAKVYGKAKTGAPPMSVPHLDTRMIGGKKALLFGPYAGFSTKFLKQGAWTDLPFSINLDNIGPMIAAGWHNIPLTKYLAEQVMQSDEDRLEALMDFVPGAKMEDWDLQAAGMRVQVIKKDKDQGGMLEFGTEVVSSSDGSIAALLGASPGASTAVSIMLELLQRCFRDKMQTGDWEDQLRKMIFSYGESLADDEALCRRSRAMTARVLQLDKEIKQSA